MRRARSARYRLRVLSASSPLDPAPATFFGVPSVRALEELSARVAFLGVPYDGGTPQPGLATGQRGGPAVAREASRGQFSYASVAPGHSLPEPGGIDYPTLRRLLAAVAGRGKVVGLDVVELNPSRDPSGVTARIAAWTLTHFLGELFDQEAAPGR